MLRYTSGMNRDFGLLLARGAIGLSFAAHGTQKAFGWFEGPGPVAAAGFLENLGFKPGARYAALTAYSEIVSGLLITLGLGAPAGPAAMIGVMLVAAQTAHVKNGFFAQKGGVEINVLYSGAALAFAMGGYGRYSLDAVFGVDEALANERFVWAAVAGGVLGGVLALSRRAKPLAPE